MIDETTLSSAEAEKLETRRSYNRKCAAQCQYFCAPNDKCVLLPVAFYLRYSSSSIAARKRNKERIAELQKLVEQLTKETSVLRSVNESMAVQLQQAAQRNLMLQELATRTSMETYNGNAAGLLLVGFPPIGQVKQEVSKEGANFDQDNAREGHLGAPVSGLESILRAGAADGPDALLRLSILRNLHEERLATAKRLRTRAAEE